MAATNDDACVDRRDLLCGGGAALLSAMLAALLGDARPARATPIVGPVPEIDRVTVSAIVDNYQFAVAPNAKVGNVDIRRFGWGLSDKPPSKTLISEFGLSLHVESQRGEERRRVLVDLGFTPEALVNNLELIEIDPAVLDALVLSHGHYDHFGGLVGFLRQNNTQLKAKLPFYVGGEECFCSREWVGPPVQGNFGVLDRKALKEANLEVTFADRPSLVADHAFTSGQIGLTSFEKVLSPTTMKIGVENGLGCFPDQLPADERAKVAVPDQFRHEIATSFNLKGRGLIVLTSCSHRGVVNTVKQAQVASGVQKVHAVIGGFHLAPYPEDYVRETVLALKEIDPDYVIPMHCTGEPFYEIAKAEMPSKLLRASTGTRFIFDA